MAIIIHSKKSLRAFTAKFTQGEIQSLNTVPYVFSQVPPRGWAVYPFFLAAFLDHNGTTYVGQDRLCIADTIGGYAERSYFCQSFVNSSADRGGVASELSGQDSNKETAIEFVSEGDVTGAGGSITAICLYSYAEVGDHAQDFIDAAGITDETEQDAIYTLVDTLKTDGIWYKMYAMYPMVGGTATTHKYNLKDPRDLDAAFRLNWVGGWTHSSNGALPNGTSGYADTFFIPNDNMSVSDGMSQGYYSRTAGGDSDEYIMGVSQSGARGFAMIARRSTDIGYFFSDIAGGSWYSAQGTVTDAAVFVQGTQNGTDVKLFNDSTTIATNTGGGNDTFATVPISIGAINNNGTRGQWTNKQCAFASIGQYLTVAEAGDYYDAVQAFQTSLSRQV